MADPARLAQQRPLWTQLSKLRARGALNLDTWRMTGRW